MLGYWRSAATLAAAACLPVLLACRPASPPAARPNGENDAAAPGAPRPAVIAAAEGERRFLRGGTAPLLIKVDPVTTGSRRMVLGSSDLPPGDAIRLHRHLREDEILIITCGTARVRLGRREYTAGAGGVVYIPQGTCVAVANIGTDTLTNFFVFSSPGFERVLREVSSPAGAPAKRVSPADRAAAFHSGHAEADPTDC